jgi:hypothetical protein
MNNAWSTAQAAAVVVLVTLAFSATARAQGPVLPRSDIGAPENVLRVTPAELTWGAGPSMLPPGASMALIEGSPSQPGPFTFRLRFPANYRIPAHWHPVKVTVTVISGTFHMGLGDELDTSNSKTLPAGSVFEMPAKIHHFGWTSEETIIQEHGVGPLAVHYLSAADAGKH